MRHHIDYDDWMAGKGYRYVYTQNVEIAKFLQRKGYVPTAVYEKGGYDVAWQFCLTVAEFQKVEQELAEFRGAFSPQPTGTAKNFLSQMREVARGEAFSGEPGNSSPPEEKTSWRARVEALKKRNSQ